MKEKASTKILLQKYEMIGKLGQGTEGKVYLVKDLHLDRLAAVKESTGPVAAEQEITGEAKLLKELSHPGLPVVYDYFQEEDKTYLVMEYVEGITLRVYLQKNRTVPIRQALQWVILLCDVLAYLHGRGQAVIYRDLKPENIMIQPDGSLKLVDLGGAMRYACRHRGEGNLAGTPGYCPPEQWREKKGDKTWDVYALSAVFHEMLTGIKPAKQSCVRLPIRQYDCSLPRGLEKVIETGTSEKKADRYQTVEELKEALLSYNKQDWRKKALWKMKEILVILFFLAAGVAVLWPLHKGVAESEIPFPFLNGPLVLAGLAVLLKKIWFGRRKKQNHLRKQEKNVWLTEKKFSGLYVIIIFFLGSGLGGALWEMTSARWAPCCPWRGNKAYASESEEKLWVEMRDDKGRKMLLKEGAVYVPEECIRFEIPADRLPQEEIRLQMVAEGEEGGVYVSRIFLIGGRNE